MKPLTPAMLRLLLEIQQSPASRSAVDERTLKALASRGLIGIPAGEPLVPYWRKRWHITDAGRRVLAEQTGEMT